MIRFGGHVVCAGCKPHYLQRLGEGVPRQPRPGTATVAEVLARDYTIDIGRHFDRAWGLLKRRPGFMFGTLALAYLLIIAASAIPILGLLNRY